MTVTVSHFLENKTRFLFRRKSFSSPPFLHQKLFFKNILYLSTTNSRLFPPERFHYQVGLRPRVGSCGDWCVINQRFRIPSLASILMKPDIMAAAVIGRKQPCGKNCFASCWLVVALPIIPQILNPCQAGGGGSVCSSVLSLTYSFPQRNYGHFVYIHPLQKNLLLCVIDRKTTKKKNPFRFCNWREY